MKHPALIATVVVIVLGGCGSMKPQDFADAEPKFRLEEYFQGQTRAYGLFEDRFGDVRRQFVVDISGTWDGTELTLDEKFLYNDGERDERVWRITKRDDHTYVGRADDVVGEATGVVYGNALNWRYDLDLKVGDRVWRVAFDDWMFLQQDAVVINRARLRKWGFEIGEVTIVFTKPPADRSATSVQRADPSG